MIAYIVTIHLECRVEHDWVGWMRDVHIPDVMATGGFDSWALSKQVEPSAPPGKVTYRVQYITTTNERLATYRQEHAPGLIADHTARYKGRFTASRLILVPAEGVD